ncbi:MAG: tetratricopeptide repeat protein [Chromatiales bacterium]|uniref:hypothetical protein n=1 Tax=endosymbiont of Lamellibrachia barhami TaxID=205975 RepID=UPI0015AD5B31|nr:hypothetical protein [endosymbiont of Lamellibrachia barhami]MBA1444248.1 hypothetical protein [Gammaproteobacteria bacterium]
MGYFLQEQGRLDEAETEYRQAFPLNPEFTSAHREIGKPAIILIAISQSSDIGKFLHSDQALPIIFLPK